MTTDPHIHQGKNYELRISPTSDPQVVEVELFSYSRRAGFFTDVPVAKLRSMIDASSPALGVYERRNDTPSPLGQAADRLIAAARAGMTPVTPAQVEEEAEQNVPECDRHIAHITTQDRVIRSRNRAIQKLVQERDDALARAEKAEAAACPDKDVHWRYDEAQETIQALRAEQTACDVHNGVMQVTDEMAERGLDVLEEVAGVSVPVVTMRAVLTAALTEPPARPAWLNAPAVRAWHKNDGRTEHDGTPGKPRIWSPDYGTTDTWSTPSLCNVPWSELVDVEPLDVTAEIAEGLDRVAEFVSGRSVTEGGGER